MEKTKGVILECLDVVSGGGDDDESGGDGGGGGGRWGGGGGGDESNVGGRVPDGLAVRIPGFHPGGPGSTPGQGGGHFSPIFACPSPVHALFSFRGSVINERHISRSR